MNKIGKIVEIGYGDVKPVKVGYNLPLVFLEDHALLKVMIIICLWLKK